VLIVGPPKFSRRSFRVSVTSLVAAAALPSASADRAKPSKELKLVAEGRVTFVGNHDPKRLILHTLKKGDQL
jgi:hypothetical protein